MDWLQGEVARASYCLLSYSPRRLLQDKERQNCLQAGYTGVVNENEKKN